MFQNNPLEAYQNGRTYSTDFSQSTILTVPNITGFDHIFIGKKPGDDSNIPGYKLVSPATEDGPAHYVREK